MIIHLDSNPTTGYIWEVLVKTNNAVVLEGDFEMDPDIPPATCGAGGQQVFDITTLDGHVAMVALQYHRPWEPDSAIEVVTVSVTKPQQ